MLIQQAGNAAGFFHREHKLGARFGIAGGAVSHRAGPDRGHEGTDREAVSGDLVGHGFEVVLADVDIGVRVKQEKIHPIELLAIHFCRGGVAEHGIQIDKRFRAGAAFADETGPGSVVKFWEVIHWEK